MIRSGTDGRLIKIHFQQGVPLWTQPLLQNHAPAHDVEGLAERWPFQDPAEQGQRISCALLELNVVAVGYAPGFSCDTHVGYSKAENPGTQR